MLEAQSGRLPSGSQRNTERRQSAMRPRLFWLSVHGGQRQTQQRQSATRVCLVGRLSVGSQRLVVFGGFRAQALTQMRNVVWLGVCVTQTCLQTAVAPLANTARYDSLRGQGSTEEINHA
jgi:hypothetical protein